MPMRVNPYWDSESIPRMTAVGSTLFQPGFIGTLEIPNRFVRSATSETMAGPNGEVTAELVKLHSRLAESDVGLILFGHLYVDPRGKQGPGQVGIYDDSLVPGLTRIAELGQANGCRIFAQLGHAGSKSRLRSVSPLAPSKVGDVHWGRSASAASSAEIEAVIDAYAAAAQRAVQAGFDGIHIHAANGYLISQFSSPLSNRRDDDWGGDSERRDRLLLEIVRRIRACIPAALPLTVKLGMIDPGGGGLELEESVARAQRIVAAGVDAIEVSTNLMRGATDSAHTYVAVTPKIAAQDLLVHRLAAKPRQEAYFAPFARSIRERVETKIILIGGMRTVETMTDVVAQGEADFVAMARPFVREPDIVSQIAAGRTGMVDCTSCNLCMTHSGHNTLRCWRTPRHRLFQHLFQELSGGLSKKLVD